MIAIFSTWTTYGTWLPGDERQWFQRGVGVQNGDKTRLLESVLTMTESAITLNSLQRNIVEDTIHRHACFRGWQLHAVNCRTNHVHVAVSAVDCPLAIPREQFKAWCTRQLKVFEPNRKNWWTQRGWDIAIDDDDALARVVEYIQNQHLQKPDDRETAVARASG